jgi:carboxypeptidase Taq
MEAWERFTAHTLEMERISGAAAALEWDQQTYMPRGAADARAGQLALLSRLCHERATDPSYGRLLDELSAADLDAEQTVAVRNALRRYRRSTCLPTRLVEELSLARAAGFNAWVEAKRTSDFSLFEAPLQRLIDLAREQARRLGPRHPYDELLEEYDPGSTVADLRPMFARLGHEIGALFDAIDGRPQPPRFTTRLDPDGQKRLSLRVLRDMGFDPDTGRLDHAEHPFTTGLHLSDVRLTTHFYEEDFLAGLGSTVHEGGHGLYEQGQRADWEGSGLNRPAGYGIHESQSRFWENFIGRSLPFFRYLVPRMQAIWPDLDVTPEALFGAANRVERSLIRVQADEATYNLHIVVRFELEVAIVEGRLQARDLPAAWDDAYGRIVGVKAPDARQGVLQDVHWSSGLLGYFPSYTIGNLYAASFACRVVQDIPDLWARVEAGDFGPILAWLRSHVHRKGHLRDAPEIFREVAGDRDPVEDLIAHLWARQGRLYGVERAG